MSQYKELKERAWQGNQELPKHGLVLYTFGNASALDRKKGIFAIKPSGIPYSMLKPVDMVIVDLENKLREVLGTKVIINTRKSGKRGKIIIDFYSLDEFDRLARTMGLTTEEVS